MPLAGFQGFKEVIAKHNEGRKTGKIHIVSELPGDGKKDQGYKCAEDALQAHPDLAAFFAINDPSALGARAALEKAGKADRVKIIGFDGQPEGKQAIREGLIYADPVQYPDRIGAMTARNDPPLLRGRGGRPPATDPDRPLPTGRRPEGYDLASSTSSQGGFRPLYHKIYRY